MLDRCVYYYNYLKEKRIKFIFICGQNRSGTTLMQRILDGHSQLLVCPVEDAIARTLSLRKTTLVKELNNGLDNFFNFVTNYTLLSYSRFARDSQDWRSFKKVSGYIYDKPKIKKRLETILKSKTVGSEKDILLAVFCSFFLEFVNFEKTVDVKYIVFKTPKTERHLDYIHRLMPNSFYIYLFRNPLQGFFLVL